MSFYVVAGMAEATLGRAVQIPYILPQTKVFYQKTVNFRVQHLEELLYTEKKTARGCDIPE